MYACIQMIRDKLHTIIFEADTPAGKAFDVGLLVVISLSILSVMLESVESIDAQFGKELRIIEWIFTIIFTFEYIVRIWIIRKSVSYIFSVMGIVDLLAILPSYLGLIFVGTQSLLVIRALRLLRIFRIFKLAHFVGEGAIIINALKASRAKLIVFLGAIFNLVIILGTVMYLVEGSEHGFTSIPKSIYWAIVTLTTVGYGDIAPETVVGQAIASVIMILGYAIIAVPTGIVTSSLAKEGIFKSVNTHSCPNCSKEGHDDNAKFCKYCGSTLEHET